MNPDEQNQSKSWVEDLKIIIKSKKTIFILFLLLGVVFGRLGINFFLNQKHGDGIPIVNTITPEVKTLESNLSLPGNMEAIEQASLYAHVGGYLKKIYVDEGDKVKEGQLLADIDAPDIVDEYNNRKADFKFKTVTRDRYQELVKEQVISQQEFDSIDAAYNEAKAKYNTAEQNMAYTHIKAPFTGSIARRYKYPGDLISVSSKDDQNPIFLLVNEEELRVVINVPQVEISNIKAEDLVDIRVDSFPGQTFKGKVSRIDALLDTSTKTERVLIDIENPENKLRAGMFASVILHSLHRDNAITIPLEAIETQGDKNYAYLDEGGSVKKIPVTLGIKEDDSVEVLDGIKMGDHLIVHGLTILSDGMKIKEKLLAPAQRSSPSSNPADKTEEPTMPAKNIAPESDKTASTQK
jgi:RND family efflux transporter MFP subunit